MSLDRRPDAQMLEGACVAYEAAIKSYETIEQQGSVIAKKALDPSTGKLVVVDVKPHPAVAQRNAAWLLVRASAPSLASARQAGHGFRLKVLNTPH